MTISELINELVEMIGSNGDIEVCVEFVDKKYGKISVNQPEGAFKQNRELKGWICFGDILIPTKEKMQLDYQNFVEKESYEK